ncbi:MAG: nuclear transport factor 2 family protein [Candidatus Dormibacteria bacterium]
MHENHNVLTRFYEAFKQHDATAMGACYAPDIEFCDPVFQHLSGDRARAMWKMLNQDASTLELDYHVGEVDADAGTVDWEAKYKFSATGRPVHNKIHAQFAFRDGLIVRHDDSFDLWRWSAQALGARGMLLGWSPVVQSAIRKQAASRLDRFVAAGTPVAASG